ncbi:MULTISPECIES: c-type cytochrome [Microvirga]|uniref:c-type cytochrome n=1 Tax=Microvirga TaxID=186650 RepID=UPI00191F519B|nr:MULTISPECIES: c-type cytochrome [Microvirga]MBM6583597.1 cytochrome c4 [Microvirga arvi]
MTREAGAINLLPQWTKPVSVTKKNQTSTRRCRRFFVLPLSATLLCGSAVGFVTALSAADLIAGRAIAINRGGFGACVACHGWHGEGDAEGIVPRLAGQNPVYMFKQLQNYASGERYNPVMSPVAAVLTEEQRANVSAYFARLTETERVRRPAHLRPGLLDQGREIARLGLPEKAVPACDSCHAPGLENKPPEAPLLAGLNVTYSSYQMHLFKSGHRDNDPLERMRSFASRLTDDEITAVTTYYSTLPASEGSP